MREKLLTQQAKAEDAVLEKMVAEMNQAPEAKKVDLEAAILTRLVAQHHRVLVEWESRHARMMASREKHVQVGKAGTSGASVTHEAVQQNAPTVQK